MRKLHLLIIIFILFVGLTNAQKEEISGNWLLTKVIQGDKPYEPLFIQNFKENGKMEAMGHELGTWEFTPNEKLLVMHSEESKEFNGEFKIVLINQKQFQLKQGAVQLFYTKINLEDVAKNNALMNFEGEWKLENNKNETQLLKIELPDTFLITRLTSGGGSSAYNGTWIFNPEENSVLFIGRTNLLKGFCTVKEISETEFTLERKGVEIIGKKETLKSPIERLLFKHEDFPEESTDISPWQDFDALLNGLKSTNYLKYKQSKLIPNTSSFSHNILISKININENERRISLSNLSIINKDTIQYSESVKGNLYNEYNDFFPQEELNPYRLVTTETITVNAGTFNCKVIEGFYDDSKVKYWMILDKPGVYAKIIREDIDLFDKVDYSIIELEEIKLKSP